MPGDPAFKDDEARPAVVLVATPIGNLGDLSPRAVEALTTADVIAAEDTRRTRPLLTAFGIPARGRLVSFHGPNEVELAARLVERIVERRERLVCVTDAGMPGISDPGERLVVAALAAGVPVEIVPGPSAALAALVLSGLPTARFVFEGFLPRKGRQRAARLAVLRAEDRTVVLFEAPHRLEATLADLAATLGPDRPVAVAREITKRFETVWRGTISQAVTGDGEGVRPEARGEQVIVIGPSPSTPDEEPGDDTIEAALRAEMTGGASTRDAAAAVATRLGVPRRRAYALATSLGKVTRE
ncbi:MAG TPA: 16S rRNA (cytidine(1402)-2'-O)-methyltransferase [Acidimicrobiia bacterium]|nr:16S rRNA (cytidine(1402)-2'-O)-methyltransferase [Acidimicrobiia bacterium]